MSNNGSRQTNICAPMPEREMPAEAGHMLASGPWIRRRRCDTIAGSLLGSDEVASNLSAGIRTSMDV